MVGTNPLSGETANFAGNLKTACDAFGAEAGGASLAGTNECMGAIPIDGFEAAIWIVFTTLRTTHKKILFNPQLFFQKLRLF